MYSTAINTSDQLLFSSTTSSSHSSQASPNQSSITEDLDSNNESSLTTLNDHIQPLTQLIGQKRSNRKQGKNANPSFSNNFSSSVSYNVQLDSSLLMTSTLSHTCNSKYSVPSNSTNTYATLPTTTSNSSPTGKVVIPKVPKPQRTLLIIDSVLNGLNLTLNDTRAKVADLTIAVTNGYNAMTKQLLQFESYVRHLEQRICALEKLQNSYNVHLKMKEGIQNMYEAYRKSPGNQNRNLTSIKIGWKECIQALCAIEAQIEAFLGTFQFQIEKLIGFARLCPGDTYELIIKYGNASKFRTRTKIQKDGSQAWTHTKFSFKITINDSLLIKINEIKFLTKNVIIGERICDTKELFSTTQTQRLTINANTSGTIKLSMLITWLPFENCEESFVYFNPTKYVSLNNSLQKDRDNKRLSSDSLSLKSKSLDHSFIGNSTLQIRHSNTYVPTNTFPNHKDLNMNGRVDSEDNKSESSSSQSSIMSSLKETVCEKRLKQISKQQEICILDSTSSNSDSFNNRLSTNSISSNNSLTHSYTSHLIQFEVEKLLNDMLNIVADDECCHVQITKNGESKCNSNFIVVDVIDEELGSINETSFKTENCGHNANKIKDVLTILKSNLDELRASYIELNDFSDIILQFEQLFIKIEPKNKFNRDTNLSLSLDNVLQCFDFLDLENVDNDESSIVKNKLEKKNSVSSISSSSNNDAEFNSSNNSLKSQLNTQSVNLYDYETLLIIHFKKCIYLLDNLNMLCKHESNDMENHKQPNFSHIEAVVFDKLNNETNILKEILKILNKIVTNDTGQESNETEVKVIIKEFLNNSKNNYFAFKEIVWFEAIDTNKIFNAHVDNLIRSFEKNLKLRKDDLFKENKNTCSDLFRKQLNQVDFNNDKFVSLFHFDQTVNFLMNTKFEHQITEDLTKEALKDNVSTDLLDSP